MTYNIASLFTVTVFNTSKRLAVARSKMTKGKADLIATIHELFLEVAQRSGCLSRTTAKVDPRDYNW